MRAALTDGGFFVLRSPVLAFSELAGPGEVARAPAVCAEELDAALAEDRACQRAWLRGLLARPEVATAVWVASPLLFDAFAAGEGAALGVEGALLRYVTRMAGRATPFGLFAGCTLGAIGAQTRLVAAGGVRWRRRTRLDADYLDRLVRALAESEELRDRVVLRPNGSLRRLGDRLRYVESRVAGASRSHHLVEVADSPALSEALAAAAGGARAPRVAAVVAEAGLAPEAAERFVHRLVNEQVLVADLALALTGGSPLDALIGDLEALECEGDRVRAVGVLRGVRDALATLDSPGGAGPGQHRAIGDRLAVLPVAVEIERLLQVDLTGAPGEVTLARSVVEDIVRGAEVLGRIAPPPEPDDLERFRARFEERFEGREVPLLEALDEELGVGYGATAGDPSALLAGLPFPVQADAARPFGPREGHLLGLLERAWSTAAPEIALTASDVAALAAPDPPEFPAACEALATLAGRQVVLHGVSGPPGAKLVGRFCDADPDLLRAVRAHVAAEETRDPDTIHAEIVHLPAGRMANIIARPVLRGYEIEWLGRSGAPPQRRLPVSDLLVSLYAGQIVLCSRRLGRRVAPRLTCAHAWSRGPGGVYRFLCDLQGQGVAGGVQWSWGPLAGAPRLPRVRCGRVIFALARWRADARELRDLDGWRAVRRWRAARRLPRWVALVEADNVLPVDLDCVLAVEAFARYVRRRESIDLVEVIVPQDGYVNEVVVPLLCRDPRPGAPRGRAASAPAGDRQHGERGAPIRRVFAPGSRWGYLKLYTGSATVERLLRDEVGPAVRALVREGAADRWFFLRYADPRRHLRVRLRGDPARVRETLETLAAASVERGLAHDAALATYKREVERYGGPAGIDLAEQIFHADSDAVIDLLGRFETGHRGLDERWRVALVGTDRLLGDLGLDEPARAALARRMRDAFAREHRADGALRRGLGKRVREERDALSLLLDARADGDHPLAPGIAVLAARSERVAPIAAELRARRVPVEDLADSFVHMWLNRLVRSAHREHEYVIYDVLAAVYSHRARQPSRPGGLAQHRDTSERGPAPVPARGA